MTAVVSKISFGLGNQLYQFAAGYALSRRLGCPLDLDVSWFDQEPVGTAAREFLLTKLVSQPQFRNLLGYTRSDAFRDRVRRVLDVPKLRYHRCGVPVWPNSFPPNMSLPKVETPVFINGVPGLGDISPQFLPDVLQLFSEGLMASAEVKVPGQPYAFIHVRLGDFVSTAHVKQKMRQLSTDYYATGMREYEAVNGKTRWLLLSDEPSSALEKMPSGFDIELGSGASEFDDLQLMAQSKGGVIANSSFSFWGGLLSQHNKGYVVAPSVWREDGRPPPVMPDAWKTI